MGTLVISRGPGQSLIMTGPDGTEIRIELVKKSGQRALFAVTAPREWKILREELLETRRDDRQEAEQAR